MGKQELTTLLSGLYNVYYQQGFQKEVSFFVDMMFQEVDKNSDGKLSFEEFKVRLHFHIEAHIPFLIKVHLVLTNFFIGGSAKTTVYHEVF